MREILFRGKNCFGKWVEGFYYQAKLRRTDRNLCDYITIPHIERGVPNDHHIVDSNTIGQYTGLTDKNGKKIFEGDVVKNEYRKGQYQHFKVIYDDRLYCWQVENKYGMLGFLYNVIGGVEIIGNIHDNPELMGGD